jgi:hypothetical protein
MLLDLRADAVAQSRTPGRAERLGWTGWSATFSRPVLGRAASSLGGSLLRPATGLLGRRSGDPRRLPHSRPHRDPAHLVPRTGPPAPIAAAPALPEPVALGELFLSRAAELGAQVGGEVEPESGDLELQAVAAVASTGSVLLTGAAAARRPLLAARRLVIRVDPATVVRFPSEIEPYLGSGEALILTGASRTADIEKQIVRGIHGPEALTIVFG